MVTVLVAFGLSFALTVVLTNLPVSQKVAALLVLAIFALPPASLIAWSRKHVKPKRRTYDPISHWQ